MMERLLELKVELKVQSYAIRLHLEATCAGVGRGTNTAWAQVDSGDRVDIDIWNRWRDID